MSIADALERNLRERAQINLPIVSELIVDDTKAACSRRTGALAESISADPWVEAGDRYLTTVHADAEYARYQDEGTGIYGPSGQRITPISASVLVFDWPAFGGTAFFRSVAGSPGTHFFTEPMPDRVNAAFLAGWA